MHVLIDHTILLLNEVTSYFQFHSKIALMLLFQNLDCS
jgi:hypothetical protein